MRRDVAADEMNFGDVRGRLGIDFREKLYEFELAFSAPKNAGDFTCARVERSEEVERTLSKLFVLKANRHFFWPSGLGRPGSRARLNRCLLVE